MPRRAHRLDANQDVIVQALRAEPDVSVFSLAGVAAGCPDLLVGIQGVTHLVEVKDGAKPPSRRTCTPEQRRWIERWHGAPVVVLTDEQTAREWARRERVVLSPDAFAVNMQAIVDRQTAMKRPDVERDHGEADDLLCAQLQALGYVRGVEIYDAIKKWYA